MLIFMFDMRYKQVKCRVARCPEFRGTLRIQASVSRVPAEPFLGRGLC
jgi:hypothetical protein